MTGALYFEPEACAFAYTPQLPPRAAIEAAVETLVAVLDAMDGDPEEGDPLNEGEPAFDQPSRDIANEHGWGAGCPWTDPDHGAEEDGEQEEGC